MVRSVGALATHYAGPETTLCFCAKIRRRDGTLIGLSGTNKVLTIDIGDGDGSVSYKPTNGFTGSQFTARSNLKVSTVKLQGFIDSGDIKGDDLEAGLYKGARVSFFEVNYQDPNNGQNILLAGFIGRIERRDFEWEAEIISLTAALKQANVVELYSRDCRFALGDARCGYPLDPAAWAAGSQYDLNLTGDQKAGDTIVPTVGNGRMYRCTKSGYGGDTEPSWDTTLGATTVAPAATPLRWRPRGVYYIDDDGFGVGLWVAGQLKGSDIWFEPSEPGSAAAFWRPSSAPTWEANKQYLGSWDLGRGKWVVPTTPNGFVYFSLDNGQTGGTEPTWPTTEGDTVVDNGVTWMCFDLSLATFSAGQIFRRAYHTVLSGNTGRPRYPQMVEFEALDAGSTGFDDALDPFENLCIVGNEFVINGVTWRVNEVPRVNENGFVYQAEGGSGGWVTENPEPTWVTVEDTSSNDGAPRPYWGYSKAGATFAAEQLFILSKEAETAPEEQPGAIGLLFKALTAGQTAFGDGSEPTWPTAAGGTVVSNGVTFEAIDNVQAEFETLDLPYRDGTVTAVANLRQLTATGITVSPAFFSEGRLTWLTGNNAGEKVKVLIDNGTGQLELMRDPGFPIEVGDTFRVYRGCFRDVFDCRLQFDNIINNGGFLTVPTEAIAQPYPLENAAPAEFDTWPAYLGNEAANGTRSNQEGDHETWFD